MRIVVTGGAGFIGSHLVEALLEEPTIEVTVVDDMSCGRGANIASALSSGRVKLIEGSLLESETFDRIGDGHEAVFHLAANGDIRLGSSDTDLDMRSGVIATRNTLDAAVKMGAREFIFASSSAVYGSPTVVPTPESYAPLVPESLYGAAKLAAEGYVSAYCHTFGMSGWIFRFANIIGPRSARGAPSDFVAQTLRGGRIRMLSDGSPTKNFTHVSDCVGAVIHLWKQARLKKVNIFNVGSTGRVSVRYIAEVAAEAAGGDTRIESGSSPRGWPGDIVDMELDCSAALKSGWEPGFDCRAAIERGVAELVAEATSSGLKRTEETS